MPRSRPVGVDPQQLWRDLADFVIKQEDRRPEVSAALGMSFGKTRALRRVAAAPEPLTLRELAVQLTTDAPNATRLVDGLEQRGLVLRRPHPSDGRVKIIEITQAGREAAALAVEIHDRTPEVFGLLSTAELGSLAEIIRDLRDRAAASPGARESPSVP